MNWQKTRFFILATLISLPLLLPYLNQSVAGSNWVQVLDHGLASAIDLTKNRPLDRTYIFRREASVYSWVALNWSSYGVYINWKWYDPGHTLVWESEQLHVGRSIFAFSSIQLRNSAGEWLVEVSATPISNNMQVLERNIQLYSERFLVGVAKIAVKIDGIPTSTTTSVYMDGKQTGILTRNETLEIGLALNSSCEISVDRYVQSESKVRYVCNENVIKVESSCSHTFSYTPQYYLSVDSIIPIGFDEGWYDKGQTVKLMVTSPITNNATRLIFVRWEGLPTRSHEPNLTFTVNQPLTIAAVWRTQHLLTVSSEIGTPIGGGWYDEGSVAKFSIEHDENWLSPYRFQGWRGDYSEDAREGSLVVDGPKMVVALWSIDRWPILTIIALAALAGLPLASSRFRTTMFSVSSLLLGLLGWLAFCVLLDLGVYALTCFSALFVTAAFGTCLFLPIERKPPLIASIILTSVLLIQELLLSGEDPFYGFVIALLGMVISPLTGSLLQSDKQLGHVLQISGIVFASRVAYAPFPGKFLNIPIAIPSLYILILLISMVFIIAKKIDLPSIGFQTGPIPLRLQLFSAVSIGILSGTIEYMLLKPPPLSSNLDPLQSTIYTILLMMVLVSFAEEILFRGLLQTSMSQILPPWVAIQIVSVQFGLMHLGWRSPIEVLFAYAMGFIMGFFLWKSKSLIAPILLHGVGNVVMFLLAAATDASILIYILGASSAASACLALYFLGRRMLIDEWSASMELRRRVDRMRQRLNPDKES